MRPKQLPADLHWPTDKEEAEIQQGIGADPDAPEWSEDDFARALPAREIVPEIVAAHERGRVRGPQKAPKKSLVSIRLDPDVLDALRASGPGWQTRANAMLRKALTET
ncbi:BrnA antitoxin family protein [Paracraurococcus lichenis]|uniref:BrnA antitoxin family protein n=1 Tax=Paracraurococcus lichenis TaxID=3064888 RepID=A0ABT9E9I8_9PROT|nr:BrnA antitoxin family protein [Paracraurococcus sp. LOR1-02]MDO9712858.1 BrnA antitoxin family protein [Paracraurococcus sp. LOR1-02]